MESAIISETLVKNIHSWNLVIILFNWSYLKEKVTPEIFFIDSLGLVRNVEILWIV